MNKYPRLRWFGRIAPLCFVVMLILAAARSAAADYVIVVDTSGSMTGPISRKNPNIRIKTVQEALNNYLTALPDDSRVYLLSFNTGITSERELILRGAADRAEGAKWVANLDKEAAHGGNTYLWSTLRRALQIAAKYSEQHPETTVLVRVLTDGEDTEHRYTLDQVLAEFPGVDGKSIRANLVLIGDMDIPVSTRQGLVVSQSIDGNVLMPPVILWAPVPVRLNQDISFFDNSSSLYKIYEWRVDGVVVGRQKALKYRFTNVATHEVALAVVGQGGERDLTKVPVEVLPAEQPEPMTVDFVFSPSQPESREPVRFMGRTGRKSVGQTWLVGDREFGKALDAEFTFPAEGRFEVRLRVNDTDGKVVEAVKLVEVRDPALTVKFKAPGDGIAGEVLQFVNETEGKLASFEWDFGDGTVSQERNPTHAFTVPGTAPVVYNVGLSATTGAGRTFKASSVPIRVAPAIRIPPPTASFRVTGNGAKVGRLVDFIDESHGLIDSYLWQFGKEGTAKTKNPSFTFTTPGTHIVQLTVTGPGGTSVPFSLPVEITKPAISISVKWFNRHGEDAKPETIDFGAIRSRIVERADYAAPEYGTFTVVYPDELPANGGLTFGFSGTLGSAVYAAEISGDTAPKEVSTVNGHGAAQYQLMLRPNATPGVHKGAFTITAQPKDDVLINSGAAPLMIPVILEIEGDDGSAVGWILLLVVLAGVVFFLARRRGPAGPTAVKLKAEQPAGSTQDFAVSAGETIDLGHVPGGIKNTQIFDVSAPGFFLTMTPNGLYLYSRTSGRIRQLKSGELFQVDDKGASKRTIRVELKSLPPRRTTSQPPKRPGANPYYSKK